jgi:cell division protease FtsH
VNRFLRSALFPLVIIVLLVYLASQTLINHDSNTKKTTYSDLLRAAENNQVQSAVFNPNRQEIKAVLTDGQKVKVHYPSDQSQYAFQASLEKGSPGATCRSSCCSPSGSS